tara:strand:+ start:141 stop:614 length:474 start_codon:yes stop_codon:yes gene_type:complete
MLREIKSFMFGAETAVTSGSNSEEPIAAAAAALLVEMAVMDGAFDTNERETIVRLISDRFDLNILDVADLVAEAEVAVSGSVELFSFTKILRDDFDHSDRIKMIEMLWEVAYADGILHDFEANLIRRATGLLHVSDRESGVARKRVLERLDIASEGA